MLSSSLDVAYLVEALDFTFFLSSFAMRHLSLYVLSPMESPKVCWCLFGGANHRARTGGGARCTGADGPRPGAGLRVSCLMAGRSARTQE
jgi:hypothetical protein